MFVLDTDHLSFLERAGHPIGDRIRAKLNSAHEDCVATIISYEEQCRGWLSTLAKAKSIAEQVSAYRKLLGQLRNYCAITVIEFDEQAAVQLQSFKKAKIRIPTMDLKIAAIARARDATLLTRNWNDFTKVPGLRIEDWTKE
jgi:tRNA(fMet)-specific endonuclease VapC